MPPSDSHTGAEHQVLHVALRPHVHNHLCERKDRVCSAEGRFREMETLAVGAISNALLSVLYKWC